LTDLRVLALAMDFRLPMRLFCTTRDGVFRSIDGGGLWQACPACFLSLDLEHAIDFDVLEHGLGAAGP
jgi:hypothetical protein